MSIGTGESLNSGTSNLSLNSTLTIDDGGTLSSGSGPVTVSGALTLSGELVQGGGILNLISGGTVGATGELDVKDSELKLGSALSFAGTLVVNSGTTWSGFGGTLDLSAGTLEASGGSINLNDFSTGANTIFKLSADTEILSAGNVTFGTLELNGNKLTLAEGSAGLTLPNTLTMTAAGSIIETKNSHLTLSNALQLDSGSITSTGGILFFEGGLTLGADGALDVTGSTLSVSQNLDLSAGTFSSSNNSILKLEDAATLSSSSPVSFGSLNLNDKVLTLGSATTQLNITDATTSVNLNGVSIETEAGSLTLSGALTMSNLAKLNSSGGTITLNSGGSLASGSTLSLPDTTLVLQNALAISASTLKTKNTTFITNGNALSLSAGILEVEGTQNLDGVFPDSTSTLSLSGNTTLNYSDTLSIGTLELANFALTLDDAMEGLTVSQAVTLDAATEQIISGDADLSLNGGITVSAGTLSSSGGTVSASSLSAGAAGILNFQGGTLSLPNGATAVSGASFTTSATTISLGGTLAVADSWTSTGTGISLTADAELSSTAPLTLATLTTNGHGFELESDTTDLTISDGLTINASLEENSGVGTGSADLTLNGPLTVLGGGISSSGGTLTFGPASGATSFVENTGMQLKDTTLVLQTNINLNYLKLTGTSTIQTNANTLSPVYLEIGTDNELDLTNAVNSETGIDLAGDSSITYTGGDLLIKYISVGGFSLALNQDITSLTAENIWLTNDYDSNRPNYMASTGKFLSQGVNVTLTKPLWLDKGKLEMGGGTLSLVQGGEVRDGGELDLSNSILELTGPFYNYQGAGTLTTSASTLRLNSNVKFEPGNDATFDTYEPNGWGMVLHNDMQDSSETVNLTLGTNGVDLTLQPNTESLTSGFVNYYSNEDGAVFDTNSHGIGIKSYDVGLTINGNVTLRDNALISVYNENISLANLSLESGNVEVNSGSSGGSLSLAGGSIGANGQLKVGGQATLNLEGDLTVAGILNLHPHSIFNLAGNTLNAAGARLELGGERSFDSITTNENTTLEVNSYLDLSRTDSGSSTIGNLELIMLEGDSGSNSLNISNMSLVIAGTAALDGKQITLNSGNLSFQGAPSFSNMSSLNVSGGELILQSGGTFSDSSLNFTSSVFRPSGTVSVTNGGSLSLNETSSITLEGDVTLTQSSTVYWPSLDLNGNTLTLNVSDMYCCLYQTGGLTIRNGESINSGASNLTVDNTLAIEDGGKLISDTGKVTLTDALMLNGELAQGGG
ncbi:MAG: hypothetical protein JKY07_02030, partial [SAR324 cluster bacterium]|nr:hypothetical protein [SAR324 cluster bacterium]